MNSFFHPRWQSWLVKPGWVDFASASLTSATDARTTRLRRTRAPVIGPRLARTRWANPHDELSALTRRPFRIDWTVRPGTGEAGPGRLDWVSRNRRKKSAGPCRTPAPWFVLRTSPHQRSSWWPIILVNLPVDLARTTASRQSAKYAYSSEAN